MAWFTLARRREKRERLELFNDIRVAMHGDKDVVTKLLKELAKDDG